MESENQLLAQQHQSESANETALVQDSTTTANTADIHMTTDISQTETANILADETVSVNIGAETNTNISTTVERTENTIEQSQLAPQPHDHVVSMDVELEQHLQPEQQQIEVPAPPQADAHIEVVQEANLNAIPQLDSILVVQQHGEENLTASSATTVITNETVDSNVVVQHHHQQQQQDPADAAMQLLTQLEQQSSAANMSVNTGTEIHDAQLMLIDQQHQLEQQPQQCKDHFLGFRAWVLKLVSDFGH